MIFWDLIRLNSSNAKNQNETMSLSVFRDESADVYGSFLIGVILTGGNGNTVFEHTQRQLSALGSEIKNDYVVKVTHGKHSCYCLGVQRQL